MMVAGVYMIQCLVAFHVMYMDVEEDGLMHS